MMNISICIGSACHVRGAYNVMTSFQQLIEEYGLDGQVEITPVFCMGQCTQFVSVKIDSGEVEGVSGPMCRKFFQERVLAKLQEATV